MNLSPLTQRFVLHFGEMGSRWGINRTVVQIYASLYVSATPMNAHEVGEALNFSRSSLSMELKALQLWSLARLFYQPNDHREYFQVPENVWSMPPTLVTQLRKREIDPTLSMLHEAPMEQPGSASHIHKQERMKLMHGFIEMMTDWLDDIRKIDTATRARLMKMDAKVQRLLEISDRMKQVFTGANYGQL